MVMAASDPTKMTDNELIEYWVDKDGDSITALRFATVAYELMRQVFEKHNAADKRLEELSRERMNLELNYFQMCINLLTTAPPHVANNAVVKTVVETLRRMWDFLARQQDR